jgi:hypothetical protein
MPPPFKQMQPQEFIQAVSQFAWSPHKTLIHMHHTWRPNYSQYKGLSYEAMYSYHINTNDISTRRGAGRDRPLAWHTAAIDRLAADVVDDRPNRADLVETRPPLSPADRPGFSASIARIDLGSPPRLDTAPRPACAPTPPWRPSARAQRS